MADKNVDMLVMTGLDSCLHCVTGRSWDDKISEVRQTMTDKNADMLVVTGIDSCLHCVTGRS